MTAEDMIPERGILRRMQLVSDQEGIINRYLRERENWEPHLQHTREFILQSLLNRNIRSVTVLGSGWLLDLPLEKLSERFEEILLVDLHHPPQIRKKVEKFKNVQLLTADLSGGGIRFAWQLFKRANDQNCSRILNEFQPAGPDLLPSPDAQISLNILSQLDTLLVDFLKKHFPTIDEGALLTFRQKIQQHHINTITTTPGCLIADVEELTGGRDGKTNSRMLLHAPLPASKRSEEWIWEFDMTGNYHLHQQTKMRVNALEW